MHLHEQVSTASPKPLRFPRPGLPILPRSLQALFRGAIRHPLLSNGAISSPVDKLDESVWSRHPAPDCKIIANALGARLSRMHAAKSARLAALYVLGVAPARPIDALPLSEMLVETLKRCGFTTTEELARHSLAEFMSLPTMGGRRVLELVAVLEALGGTNVAAASHASTSRVKGSPEDHERLDALLELLGESDVESRDLRFGELIVRLGTQSTGLKAAVATLKTGLMGSAGGDPWPALRGHLAALQAQLLEVKDLNLPQDLQSVLTTLTGARKAGIVARRLGWTDGIERTLQEVGDEVGLTRERVRQMEARAQLKLANRSVYAPALLRALRLAQRMTPCAAQEFSKALMDEKLTDTPWPPGLLVRAAGYLGIAHGLTLEPIGDQEFLAGDSLTSDVFARVQRLSWASARSEGAAHLPRIAFALSEELQRRVSLAEIRSIVTVLQETRWIDEVQGWYWMGDAGHTTIFNTTRKLLSVARRLPIDDLYEGLLKSYRMDEAVVAPKPILLKMFGQVPWLRIRQRSHVEAHPSLRWQEVLTGVERTMVQVLTEAGGVLDHHDFRKRCKTRGVPHSTFGVYEGNSGLFVRVARAIWSLRGVDVDAEKFVQVARKVEERRLRIALEASERTLSRLVPGSNADGRYMRLYRVTASTFRHHVMTLARMRQLAPGTRFAVSLDGATLGSTELTEDHRLRGLLPLLRRSGVQPGQTFLAQFNLVTRQMTLETLPDEAAN